MTAAATEWARSRGRHRLISSQPDQVEAEAEKPPPAGPHVSQGALLQGTPVQTVGAFVGQRSLKVTLDTYTHVLMDERELDYAALVALHADSA